MADHQRSGSWASATVEGSLVAAPMNGVRPRSVHVLPESVVSQAPGLPYWVMTAWCGTPGVRVTLPSALLGPTGCHFAPRASCGVTSNPPAPY